MAIMANVTPIEVKPNTSSQASTSKKNNSSSNKSGVDFGKVLNNQSDKSEKEDASTKTDSAAAQLISGMMGLNAQVNAAPIQSNENLIAELPTDDAEGQLVTTTNTNQLTESVGKTNVRLDVATGMNTSQKQLAALLTKGTDVNVAAGNTNANQFTMQLQELLQNKQLTEQAQVSDPSLSKASVTTNNALLETVPSFALVNSNGVGKTNNMPQADNKKTTQTQAGVATLDITQLIDSVDAKPVATSPLLTNVVSAVENVSESGTMLLGAKEQLSVESLLPNQTTNTSDTFAGALNQQVMKNENQVVVSVGKQVTQQPVKDSYHVASQIVDQARLISGQKNTEMIIQLKPEHLGELTLKVTVESGVVSASFHSNNSEVRNIIEASLPQLKQELSNQGLKIENVDVYAGLGDFFSNGQHESRQKPEVKVQNKKIEEDFLDALDDSTSVVESSSEGSGVDYRI
ncbi:flagellar hook-length control protein FliK [Pelosinus fermentans]|uniref:Flagellar hook-length control protein-like protein n=1 Tax=Pelosinus fermentans JBW45 TaxID=1192197 RepID=I9DLL4_9FIRM|nr:flagellar hook-length control protein FliK [Pelosinus fermentans]AJQ27320.1 Flagellar hook-length control protein-like protein [Pelosinus fermentans JBW45]